MAVELQDGVPYYSVYKGDTLVINQSKLGLSLKEGGVLGEDMALERVTRSAFSERWTQVWGEDAEVENRYNELTLELRERTGAKRPLTLLFRAFEDGVGFRYLLPSQSGVDSVTVMDELTEFNLPGAPQGWSMPKNSIEFYEGLYTRKAVSAIDTATTPLTIEADKGLFLTLHEANLTEWAGMNLTPQSGSNNLKVDLTAWSTGEKVFAKLPAESPWRTVIVAEKAGDLLLSRMMLNLNEPCKIEDTSWIEPGRYIGIWWGMHMEVTSWHQGPKHGATTENTLRHIDFAAKHGFAGVLVEGWNWGWDGDWTRDGDRFSFTEAYPDFDLKRVAEYAREKGVRLVGHHETGGATRNYEQQMDSAFALYESLGVRAVKTGYVQPRLDGVEHHSSQYGVRHYRKVVETAAKYRIAIDNHEPAMPSGLQRTFPNLMTQEGARGQEYDAWAKDGGNPPAHTTILPFTRGLAGPIDFTPGTFNFENLANPNTRVRTTLAKQLALSVVIYSPLQMASDMIENYEKNLAPFEFITSCPTTWSRTVVPHAIIGEYVTIARKDRHSESWFVGSVTNERARELTLPLDFLEVGVRYTAKIFRDGVGADYLSNPYPVVIEEMEVTSETVLSLQLATSGGTAIRLIPQK